MAGSLRSLFVAAPRHRLVCSDYRAIEAVVLAALAGEQWRLDVFRSHGKIYEMSASKITGIPFDRYLEHKRTTGDHHPTRQSVGKVAELASGYGGGVGAWRAFGAHEHFPPESLTHRAAEYQRYCDYQRSKGRAVKSITDWHIQSLIYSWRDESPNIVLFWGGLESAAKRAIAAPGSVQRFRAITYQFGDGVLRCILPSGRALHYQGASVRPAPMPWGGTKDQIHYFGHNSNPKAGPLGWAELRTYGGKLTENVVQAVSRDILAHGMLNVDDAGYRIVLHVHDEAVGEEPDGHGSVEEIEALLGDLPRWAADWPVIAAGGWTGREYRKD